MKSKNRDNDYLNHILKAINKIETYQNKYGETGFYQNEMMQDAIIRNLEIIGEAVSKLTPDIKEKHKNIPWREISGMRNRLIHGYMSVDLEIVWSTTTNILPDFSKQILKII